MELYIKNDKYLCPIHGVVKETIDCTIEGSEGQYCMRCWIALLGKPMEKVEQCET